ncbi:MAG: hypothetical protein AB8C13_07235 [Phycisphaerales bacterium]
MSTSTSVKIYDEDAGALLAPSSYPDRVSLLPIEHSTPTPGDRLRIMWGQNMLSDVLDGRYRAVVCGVNDTSNESGVIAQLVSLVTASQWSAGSVTNYARMFQDSVSVHAASDREPYILKFDLDSVLILGILRPKSQDYFSLTDLARGFSTINKMLQGRPDRRPVCSVSFLGAKSNRLVIDNDSPGEPSFETVLRTMYSAGYRGDVYPSPQMWDRADVGVFPSYPFPAGLDRMRAGSS